jgi:hypothetical protein
MDRLRSSNGWTPDDPFHPIMSLSPVVFNKNIDRHDDVQAAHTEAILLERSQLSARSDNWRNLSPTPLGG